MTGVRKGSVGHSAWHALPFSDFLQRTDPRLRERKPYGPLVRLWKASLAADFPFRALGDYLEDTENGDRRLAALRNVGAHSIQALHSAILHFSDEQLSPLEPTQPLLETVQAARRYGLLRDNAARVLSNSI